MQLTGLQKQEVLEFYKVGTQEGITLAPMNRKFFVTIPFGDFIFYYDDVTSIEELDDEEVDYKVTDTI